MQPNRINGYTRAELERMCLGKHRWPDEVSAIAGGLMSLEQNPELPRLYTYRCPSCRGWHLTRNRHGQKRLIARDKAPLPDQPKGASHPGAGAPVCSVEQGVVEARKLGR